MGRYDNNAAGYLDVTLSCLSTSLVPLKLFMESH